MVTALPQFKSIDTASESIAPSHGCGTSCGKGLEKIYPATAVRFGAMNAIGEFKYKPGSVFKCGAKVVIESERGIELGQQVSLSCTGCDKHVSREQIKRYVETSGAEYYRFGSGRVLREATDQDVDEHKRLNANVAADIDHCALTAALLGLELKVVTAEHLLGGERVVFYFRSETRVDFRELVRELAKRYQTRIEMRQVGARDEARLVADYEICGRECCCKNFLKKLRPISMKMAKVQKSTLDPSKVSGRCGRLRCCLRYEHEGYEELEKKLPRVGARVDTESGPATVVDRQILTQLVIVRTDDNRRLAVPIEDLRDLKAAPSAPSKPAATPPDAAREDRGKDRQDKDRAARDGRPRRAQGRNQDGGADAKTPDPKAGPEQAAPAPTSKADDDAAKPGADAQPPEEGSRFVADEQPKKSRRRRRRRRGRGGDSPPKE